MKENDDDIILTKDGFLNKLISQSFYTLIQIDNIK